MVPRRIDNCGSECRRHTLDTDSRTRYRPKAMISFGFQLEMRRQQGRDVKSKLQAVEWNYSDPLHSGLHVQEDGP